MSHYFMYIADPMCSWCWGFAPIFDRLLEKYDLPVHLVVGGLRPGSAAKVLDEDMRLYLQQHWQSVEEASGQAFNSEVLARENWLYDTELPARAIVTMRQRQLAADFNLFKLLQKAFYADAVDITNPDVYAELLAGFDVDADGFVGTMLSEEMRALTYEDFSFTQSLGIRGFPSLILGKGGDLALISQGYQSFERLDALIDNQLKTS